MKGPDWEKVYLSVVAAIAITVVSAAAPINIFVSHSINVRGELSQICTTQVTVVNGGLPSHWLSDSYSYCGGYKDSLSVSPQGLPSDIVAWLIVSIIILTILHRMNLQKRKRRWWDFPAFPF